VRWRARRRASREAPAPRRCSPSSSWTGTGASLAANKVTGIRAALCADAETARGARTWNHANVLALSLRSTSEPVAREILDAWFSTPYSQDEWNQRQVEKIRDMEKRPPG